MQRPPGQSRSNLRTCEFATRRSRANPRSRSGSLLRLERSISHVSREPRRLPFRTLTSMPLAESTPWVKDHVARSIALWNRCAGLNPSPARLFPRSEQRQREKAYDQGVRSVEAELRTRAERVAQEDWGPRRQVLVDGVEERIISTFGRFATTALGLERDAVDTITRDFLPVGTGLARWTRRFDPTMSKMDIIQACRNAWTACGLQPLLGRQTELTPPILAYSLMYPYTDNYIDRADISDQAKSAFSARFRERLCGELPEPQNEREAALWTLVALVEGQYPRCFYPQVFDSLLAIHAAQERSIAQLKNGGRSTDADVLEISCEKGGTSVLADAFLVRGDLSDAEARFAFDWGVLLQLGDDLQDLRDDLRRQSATLFTRAVRRRERLDTLVTQLLVFSDGIAAGMDNLPCTTPTLRTLLPMSWRSLIVEAVADLREFFTRSFLRELERTHPFRLKFLRKRHHRLTRRKGLYDSLFDVLIESPDDEISGLPFPECQGVVVS